MARILIEAIQNGQETLAKDIIQGGTYGCIDSQTSKRDGTALFFCCSRGYLELAKLLIERGACVTSTDKTQATPLHGAVDNGHLDIVRLLLDHGADVNAQTCRGDTPLHLAAYRGHTEITRILVEAGADCRLVNNFKLTAENEARTSRHLDLSTYLKAAQNERQPEESDESLDSLMRLDPPSDVLEEPSASQQQQRQHQQSRRPEEHLEQHHHHHHHQQQQQHKQHCDGGAQRRTTYNSNDVTLRPKIPARDLHKYNNLSFIELDPPADVDMFDTSGRPGQNIYFHQKRNGAGRSVSEIQHRPHMTLKVPSPSSRSSLPVLNSTPPLPASIPCLTPPVMNQTPRSTSPHLLNPPVFNNFNTMNNNAPRRPSTGSTGSCFSDVSGGTGSDASSLISSGSDASIFYSDTRREDIDDFSLVSNCHGSSHMQDRDLSNLSQTYGVKFPPTEKARLLRRMSSTSAPMESSSEFSDIYDSSMFSLSSLVSGPPSSMMSGCSSGSMDSAASNGSKSCSSLYRDDTGELRPQLSRAVSVNSAHPLVNMRQKGRPDFNKSISAESNRVRSAPFSPQLHHNIDHGFCPSFNAMPSNDLSSSSLSIPEKSRSSMTCVNIPIN